LEKCGPTYFEDYAFWLISYYTAGGRVFALFEKSKF